MQLEFLDHGVVIIRLESHANEKGDYENRFNLDVVQEFNVNLDKILETGARALVITGGTGKFFSNGHDVVWLEKTFDNKEAHRFIIEYYKLLARLLAYPLPTVAAVNGHAFAGGCLLAMALDYRVMRPDRGFICMNEIDMVPEIPSVVSKITPGCFEDADYKMISLLKQKIDVRVLRDMLLQGMRFDGTVAKEKGLVDSLSPDVLEEATKLARQLGKKAHRSNRRTFAVLKFEQHRECIQVLTNNRGSILHEAHLSKL
jgi:enoyl-CoA hydratase/carnithine racemase